MSEIEFTTGPRNYNPEFHFRRNQAEIAATDRTRHELQFGDKLFGCGRRKIVISNEARPIETQRPPPHTAFRPEVPKRPIQQRFFPFHPSVGP